ncbi:UNVERIFIED_CONTAM: LINE-1 retrotransposable element O protein [Sesamum radiatum]|uniref:LINE-1 retrotransposable element O protein n=1 Tax=Sesamum radiatum TaxID=300843 RepID=A0AAW2RDZ4_SESRA
MNRKIAEEIGNSIGKFIFTNLSNESHRWRKALRVRIEVDVKEPLKDHFQLISPDNKNLSHTPGNNSKKETRTFISPEKADLPKLNPDTAPQEIHLLSRLNTDTPPHQNYGNIEADLVTFGPLLPNCPLGLASPPHHNLNPCSLPKSPTLEPTNFLMGPLPPLLNQSKPKPNHPMSASTQLRKPMKRSPRAPVDANIPHKKIKMFENFPCLPHPTFNCPSPYQITQRIPTTPNDHDRNTNLVLELIEENMTIHQNRRVIRMKEKAETVIVYKRRLEVKLIALTVRTKIWWKILSLSLILPRALGGQGSNQAMKILAWNCRGLARPTARRMLRDLLQSHKPDIIFLCEVKTSHTDKISSILLSSNLIFSNFVLAVNKAGVHCPAVSCFKPVFWQSLNEIHQSFAGPWLVVGDFNAVLSQVEKRGGKPFASASKNSLRDELDSCNLIDLGFSGYKFTWSNKRPGMTNIQSRLDRGVANAEWCLFYPKAHILNLSPFTSDHSPLLLDTQPASVNRPRPFFFEEMWLQDFSCESLVADVCLAFVAGNPISQMHCLLRRLRTELRKWNRRVFGWCHDHINTIKAKLEELQPLDQTSDVLALQEHLQTDLDEQLTRLQIKWRQKAKQRWLEDGDANTKFFHLTAILQSKANFIHSIKTREAINHTYITLIPKNLKADTVDKFRPISLCNTTYKIISKLLANRLKPLLNKLNSPLQMAFVPGRTINENTIISQEIMHYLHCKKGPKSFMAIKIDLMKAYDRVEWPFLLQVLRRLGFCDKFVDLIQQCITTSSFSLLINGSPFDFFRPSRGIRQGDPLSPYLFIIYTEILSRLLLHEEALGNIKGIKVCRNAPSISHLLYADDLTIFCRAEEKDAHTVRKCLDMFEQWSSQCANCHKSFIHFSSNVLNRQRRNILEILHMPECGHKAKHLGFPFCKPESRAQAFSDLTEKMSNRYGTSWLWQDVIKCIEIIKLGACFPVSTTSNVRIWEDPWIPSIQSYIPTPREVTTCPRPTYVRELIVQTEAMWNFELLH